MPLARIPQPGRAVPPAMAEAAGGAVTLVWQNKAGGLTGRVGTAVPRYIKWNPAGSGESLAAEAERLRWLEGRHPAPTVVDHVVSGDAELLVTEAIPGRSAVDPMWIARPDEAIRAIAVGLRTLHGLPVESCPFDWAVASRIDAAASAGISAPETLRHAPPVDRLVVCQGDPCPPNTLLGNDGRFVAHVDMGRLGVADRWADLAVATMAFEWNYRAPDPQLFWDTYGIDPDREHIAYYRALWDAT